ncbi:MAG: ATP phosphoribosyltransferase regulatory subunit [Alphaproteobacteria bacterium]|jgi:ATP phosphoribosyltransferase regulatory subunit|nr:ATP phosphoribosyltransferase regulatory subunit [Alphaproteobacteria bacterium]PPR14557.1 MAG: ATP phosphoribosyltransferase regulatory subunit [Alphaproteobacteria bacterium MarineAlpha12_Bin1]|tara:strand:+ start:1937 stop:3139 length:1203 start_codon:yes stop_codon:yes gene_type:complete
MPTNKENKGLLPSGLHDLLPPNAALEDRTIRALIDTFRSFGYDHVKPPLIEFENTLTASEKNGGGTLSGQMFRLMDPTSERMMGVRADITLQVARIAETRLKQKARPLRLSYAGEVLRVKGSQLRPERMFAQAGVELIGSNDISSDVEMVVLASNALAAAGISEPTIDLNSPALVTNILADIKIDPNIVKQLRSALDHKDSTEVHKVVRKHETTLGKKADVLNGLLEAIGPAEDVILKLRQLELPDLAVVELDRLELVVNGVLDGSINLSLTIDPVEYRGFEYHTGVSFTIFAAGVRGELGRGGRYITSSDEPATGFSLYLDSIMRALPDALNPQKLYLPFEIAAEVSKALRSDGWITVTGLTPITNIAAEARRLECSHYWVEGKILSSIDQTDISPKEA